jgi:hypothetical protein
MSSESIEAIERSIKRAKVTAEFGDAIERLRANKDFKTVFGEGYFKAEAIRLVHLKADPSMQSADSQKSIIGQMDAIGSVSQYLTTAIQMGHLARKEIADGESVRDEMLAEDLNQ